MKAFVKSKPMIAIFWAWIILSLAAWVISVVNGSLYEIMLKAVDLAEVEVNAAGIEREDMAKNFIYISFAYFIFSVVIGALLVHFATADRKWAKFLLIPCAIWWGYESVSFPFATSEMYPGMIGWSYWVLAFAGGAVWSAILILDYHKLRKRVL